MRILIALIISSIIFSCTTKTQTCKPKIIEKTKIVEKPVYIKPEIPELPKKPKMKKVKFEKIGNYYCINKKQAKELLKNIYKLDNYSRELETILKDLNKH